MSRPTPWAFALTASALLLASCGNSNSVNNPDQARRAYLGLDLSVDKVLNLALKGYNDSTSANIPTETDMGGTSGTVAVDGHVDHGASTNRAIHVVTTYTNYADPVNDINDGGVLHIVYDTAAMGGPAMDLMLLNVPNGTVSGTMTGAVNMSGDLMGSVTLNLSISGNIQPVPGSTTQIERVPGSTHITGTATSQYGTYNVDVMR